MAPTLTILSCWSTTLLRRARPRRRLCSHSRAYGAYQSRSSLSRSLIANVLKGPVLLLPCFRRYQLMCPYSVRASLRRHQPRSSRSSRVDLWESIPRRRRPSPHNPQRRFSPAPPLQETTTTAEN